MRSILFSFLLLISVTAVAQNVTNHQVEPKGVYKEINLSNDIRVISLLLDTNLTHSRSALIDSVEKDANKYTPPVLYALSNILFVQKRYNEGCYWFYIAQLRARYDVNRCADKTANASAYNQSFGPVINEYAFKHVDSLKVIMPKVVDFVKTNEELYDQRWINLSGMGAMTESLGGKPTNKELSIARDQWPAIKKKTIDTYYSDFKDAYGLDNDDTTVDREHMFGFDYRLFKGTPAWELAKAVQDEDTVKIKQEVSRNKSLLSFREPRFGQPLLSFAVMRSNYNSVKTLLELGADPNMQSTYDGGSPLTEACKLGLGGFVHDGADPRYLELLLKYGANPNIEGHSKPSSADGDRDTPLPLTIACEEGNFDYVKVLVNAGAKIDYSSKFGSLFFTAVAVGQNPDIVMYLIEKGMDYKKPIFQSDDGKRKFYLTDEMREWTFDLNSDYYKSKMKLVDFLKENGMDYRGTKIPKNLIELYPKEYLEKY
ncbi:MAG TPA: ankyrin repeat domain-containing protein [Mucilaginibacter sp.]|jgi:hypothetical protein|nr:ankyrin repeat domain-containing protein [Mucilaginibacter sp.]